MKYQVQLVLERHIESDTKLIAESDNYKHIRSYMKKHEMFSPTYRLAINLPNNSTQYKYFW